MYFLCQMESSNEWTPWATINQSNSLLPTGTGSIGDVDEIAGVAGDDNNDDDDDGNSKLPGELDDDVDLPGVDTGIDDNDQAPPDIP